VSYYSDWGIMLLQAERFIDVVFNPLKSPVPWAMGGFLLLKLWEAFQCRQEALYGKGIEKFTKAELGEAVESWRTKADSAIIEKIRLKKELERCRKGI